MKVFEVVSGVFSGGMSKHVAELSNSLGDHLEVFVVSDISFSSRLGKNVTHIPFEFSRHGAADLFNFWRLVKKYKPDIVHAHGNKASRYLNIIRVFITIKTISTIHWELKRKQDENIYKRVNAVIGVSKKVLENIDNKNKFVIYNGIDNVSGNLTKKQLSSLYSLDNNKPLAVAVGRMVKVKGFDILLHAWKDVEANLLLVGEGPLSDTLKTLARKLNIEDRVRFVGSLENVMTLISAVDLVVLSSLHEGFGYVIAEALVSRKPIISTSVSMANYILPADWVAEVGSCSSLSEKIHKAFNDLEKLDRELSGAYMWAENNLMLRHMVEKTLECYREVYRQV